MEELSEKQVEVHKSIDNNIQETRGSSNETSEDSDSSPPRYLGINLKEKKSIILDKKRAPKRITPFSDSDTDNVEENLQNGDLSGSETTSQTTKSAEQDEDSESNIHTKSTKRKSRIHRNILSGSEESETEVGLQTKQSSGSNSENEMKKSCGESDNAVKNEEQQLRMKNKRNTLKDKFKNLLTVRSKQPLQVNIDEEVNRMDSSDSSESDAEMASIEKIKQKIKERMSFKPSICDPDTSDEESNHQKSNYKQKKERKIKLTSPKPQRMSAKQAMENMQKIKSESNRMLREKEVSLPYHRPKALSLKDIMSRRKLAVSSDGKTLPIKMNEEQLKHYAKMLEEKQKEMLELCKSESEGEENEDNPAEADTSLGNKTDNDNLLEKVSIEITSDGKSVTSPDLANDNTEIDKCTEITLENESSIKDTEQIQKENGSESMRLVYNESAESLADDSITEVVERIHESVINSEVNSTAAISNNIIETKSNDVASERETIQSDNKIEMKNTDTDTINSITQKEITEKVDKIIDKPIEVVVNINDSKDMNSEDENCEEYEVMDVKEFSDDDINMEDIDNIIENAEIIKNLEDKVNSQILIRDKPLNLNPKLTGAPGMVIDLDNSNTAPRKSGVELLKERFTYFSKLKTPEEIEREREKKIKPGTQLKKLKQELEEKIAEQRSLEWAKRLDEEKQQQKELKALRGEESEEDDIDKIEATIEEKEEIKEDSEESDSGEEEPEENDIEIKDKPRKRNAMVEDEAEESECEEAAEAEGDENDNNDQKQDDYDEIQIDNDENQDDYDDSETGSDSDESSESEEEQTVAKKGRILKAFEDSDDENIAKDSPVVEVKEAKGTTDLRSGSSVISNFLGSQITSQDDDLQLAQRPISTSDDLFTSQESALLASESKELSKDIVDNDDTFTQTFSILEASKQSTAELDLNSSSKSGVGTKSLDVGNIEDVAFAATDTQNHLSLPSQIPITQQSQTQAIGDDVLALCTGQFYNNQFVSQVENQPPLLADAINYDAFDNYQSQDTQENLHKDRNNLETEVDKTNLEQNVNKVINHVKDKTNVEEDKENSPSMYVKEPDDFIELNTKEDKESKKEKVVDDNLKSILDELADPEFDAPKPNKYFLSSNDATQLKRKLVIDSDDEAGEGDVGERKKRKKFKKKKLEKRALQISDDEEELPEEDGIEVYESDLEEDEQERLVEYDSEENEIEIKPRNPKKKRKMAEFFENEAELTSEDEWVGSGDEDEAGLDRMEREEGDDETFHQGKLQRELGQIHMRDVLDQDKREVRLIQELLFEDGDLGAGGRQRKFKWNNMGDEETGTVPDEFADTQEEEFESEEQWRKQRHEREMFLRQLHNKDEPDDSLNISVNRTTIIKANLLSKTMSSILMEVNQPTSDKFEDTPVIVEKKTAKDITSPKKPFALLQQSYQGSLLSRGRGALARLAALATPLAADDDAKLGTIGPTSRRNFVFATLTPEEKEPKITKRKAESNPSTPNLVKKIRIEERNTSRSSLLDHFQL